MTDGEKRKFADDLNVLQQAIVKTQGNPSLQAIYAAMAMTLGAVLEGGVYFQNYENVMREIRKFGVVAVPIDLRPKLH